MDCLRIFAGWYHLRPRMPGSYVFAPRCGRAIFCATASWSKRVSGRAISAVTQMAMLLTMLKNRESLNNLKNQRSVQSGTPLYAFPRESSGSWNLGFP